MTSAAAVFCCMIALAFVQGFGSPAFASVIASDAFDATLPFLGVLLVARFVARRRPASIRLVQRVHVVVQALLAAMAFGWWWVEPHAMLTVWTGSSLAAMGWQALAGAIAGLALALVAERATSPMVMREVWLAAGVVLLLGGGRVYRAYDHVVAGVRLEAALAITAAVVTAATIAYFLLRRRERIAAAIPALAPALACTALLVASQGAGPAAPPARDSILLVVVDTLRADIADGGTAGEAGAASGAVSGDGGATAGGATSGATAGGEGGATSSAKASAMAGGEGGTMAGAMPELARIAESGVRFTQAVSPAPWTLPAMVSLLGGWNPHRHGFGASASHWEVTTGDPRALHLPAALRDAGYMTAAFVNNPYLRPWFGFGGGFYTMRPYHGRALDGVAIALGWLSDHADDPSFGMLHLMDPHWPYDAPPGFGEERRPCASCSDLLFAQYGVPSPADREELRRRYVAEVRFTDAMLGRLYDTLSGSGALDRTWLIVTADHGEEFWEHGGFLHGHALHDELLRVPLVVVPPRTSQAARRGVRVDAQVRLEDVAATMLEIAGLEAKLAPDGRSLLPLVTGGTETAARVAVGGFVKSVDDFSYSIRRPPWKALVAGHMAFNRLYDLGKDPGEQENLLFDPATPAARRAEIDHAWLSLFLAPRGLGLDVARERPADSGSPPDADTARNLRSLGYAN